MIVCKKKQNPIDPEKKTFFFYFLVKIQKEKKTTESNYNWRDWCICFRLESVQSNGREKSNGEKSEKLLWKEEKKVKWWERWEEKERKSVFVTLCFVYQVNVSAFLFFQTFFFLYLNLIFYFSFFLLCLLLMVYWYLKDFNLAFLLN
jgi:hypothetical protein